MDTIVLASSSPRRKELLVKYNNEPIIVKADVYEKFNSNETVEQIAMALAFEKANKVKDNFSAMPVYPKKGSIQKIGNVVIVKFSEQKGFARYEWEK